MSMFRGETQMTQTYYGLTMTYYVMFNSPELETPESIGPFDTLEDAEDYADYQNTGLSYGGHPALYSVV